MDDSINEGAHGKIFTTPFGVVKIAKRRSKTHDTTAQRRFHAIVESILVQPRYVLLKTPALSENLHMYEMRRVDTSVPLWQPTNEAIKRELVWLWEEMWQAGFVLYDFELYAQSEGTVMILDFDATGFRMKTEGESREYVTIPGKTLVPADFFLHPCFPPDFEEQLAHLRLPIGKRNI
jgi:hypothetical protein